MTSFARIFRFLPAGSLLLLFSAGCQGPAQQSEAQTGQSSEPSPPHVTAASDIEAGKYLVTVGGCNDCHTPGWAESNGQTPTSEWLTGSGVGYRGPWGTTYPGNLRLLTSQISEDQWVELLRTARGGTGRPPMPWMNTQQTSESDLRNMYRFITSLGAKGDPAPAYVPPNAEPSTPFIRMVPES